PLPTSPLFPYTTLFRSGVTLFMTLLAAFQMVLGRWSGQSDIAVGTPIANRTQVEVEGLIGFFVNQLVLRSQWDDNPQFTELLKRDRKSTRLNSSHLVIS